jgi:MoxR-like ATPase
VLYEHPHEADVDMTTNATADTTDDPQLFFIPASGVEAKKHVSLSISRPIAATALEHLPIDVRNAAQEPDGHIYAWAARPGTRNIPTWESMRPGDVAVFYSQGVYSYVATIKHKRDDAAFAEALWGRDSSDRVWQYIFFLTKPRRVDVPLDRLGDYLQDSAYQGFLRLPEQWRGRILSDYDSVTAFVEDKLLSLGDVPSNFVLIRSNDNSPWNDAANSYHFGRNVPNYKKLRVGTAVAIDRGTRSGVVLIGTGRVTDISEDADGKFRASLTVSPTAPRNFTTHEEQLLKLQPKYNQQHAIRPIDAELFRSLAGLEQPGPIEAERDIVGELAEALSWKREAAARIIAVALRSSALLLYGPPGTGKTHAAKALADVLTRSVGDVETVVFHPAYAYEDFVEGIRPNVVGDSLAYRLHRGALLRLIDRASQYDDGRRVVLIIDELSRGNVPRIFGELIHSIEYRGKENQVALPSGGSLIVPDNLLIIATMNTADRSVIGLDAALRRRFNNLRFDPDYEALRTYLTARYGEAHAADAVSRLNALNDELESIFQDRHMRVGHTFLMNDPTDGSLYERVWDEKLDPILTDYFYDRSDDIARLRDVFLARS